MRIKYGIKVAYYYEIKYNVPLKDELLMIYREYKNDIDDGEYLEWYENAKIKMRWHFKNGKKNGECKDWYNNGQIESIYYMKDNMFNGEYKDWYDNGKLLRHCYYKNDMKVKEMK